MLNCKRCDHEWTERKETPKVCPRCKSKHWESEKTRGWEKTLKAGEDSLNILIKKQSKLAPFDINNVDYLKDISFGCLQTLTVMLCEAEKEFTTTGDIHTSLRYIDICKDMVVHKFLPEGMYFVFERIMSHMMKEFASNNTVQPQMKESELKRVLIEKWGNITWGENLEFIKADYKLPDSDWVDILAKDKKTGQDVIIELKVKNKNGYKQLRAYSFFFDNPRLMNISVEEVAVKKEGIEYFLFSEIIGQSPVLSLELKS